MNSVSKPNPLFGSSLSATFLLVLAHLVAWMPVAFLILRVVPGFKPVFADLKVPWGTEIVLSLSDWVVEFHYLLPLPLLLFALLDGAILHVLRKKPSTMMLGWLWFILVIAAAIASALLVIWSPMNELMEPLSK